MAYESSRKIFELLGTRPVGISVGLKALGTILVKTAETLATWARNSNS